MALSYRNLAGVVAKSLHSRSVAFEGFVLCAGGDYTVCPSIMLLVQVMAYVMSDMIRRRYSGVRNMPLEPGPLIGSPIRTVRPGLGKESCRRGQLVLSS